MLQGRMLFMINEHHTLLRCRNRVINYVVRMKNSYRHIRFSICTLLFMSCAGVNMRNKPEKYEASKM